MTQRQRIALLAAISAVALAIALGFGISAFLRFQAQSNAPSSVPATHGATFSGPRIEFRNTAPGKDYGVVGSVPLSDPGGTRALSTQSCNRVYATNLVTMCLQTDAGIVTTWKAVQTGATGRQQQAWSLPGVPSRTRISADSKLVAETSFVTGASYATVGFSTETIIATSSGKSYGNIESFRLLVDGQQLTAPDRNIWGVTFVDGDRYFYATAASGGTTWLVRGDLKERTLTSVHETAECPSLSPDGTRVAFKENHGDFSQPDWHLVVLDLASGKVTQTAETRSVDDQAEWLDDSTLLYGLPHAGSVGDSDVWSVPADGSGRARVLIPHAWSPSVVR